MTNYERIQSMTIGEMANVIMCPHYIGLVKIPCGHGDDKDCHACCLKWLQDEEDA